MPPRTSRKRSHRTRQQQLEEGPSVDDLEVAAAFANPVLPAPAPAPVPDNDEIEIADDDSDDSSEQAEGIEETHDELVTEEESSQISQKKQQSLQNLLPYASDDDEDEDVEVADDERVVIPSISQPPRTAHEIDPYQLDPTEPVESTTAAFNVEKEQADLETTGDAVDKGSAATSPLSHPSPSELTSKFATAGAVHCHLREEHILVFQSVSEDTAVLKEGTSVWLSINRKHWVALGGIVEVFGPIRRPFYSVRLPIHRDDDSSTTDPWHATTGTLTRALQQCTSQSNLLYFQPHPEVTVHTPTVWAASQRGSDASNWYDEEVTDPAECDYSDDEEERKSRRKGPTGRESSSQQQQQQQQHCRKPTVIPEGFYPKAPVGPSLPPASIPVQAPTIKPESYPSGSFSQQPGLHHRGTLMMQQQQEEEPDTVYYEY